MDYHEIPALSGVYLEDSYVLAVHEYDNGIVFDLDVVLTENHLSYEPPQEGDQYCYKKASLIFSGVGSIEWLSKRFIKLSDAAGENDYGNIDSFSKDGDFCFLVGDWGAVRIKCSSVELVLDR